ncbi:hypothetical protein D3C76_1153530 [compost metagenome]
MTTEHLPAFVRVPACSRLAPDEVTDQRLVSRIAVLGLRIGRQRVCRQELFTRLAFQAGSHGLNLGAGLAVAGTRLLLRFINRLECQFTRARLALPRIEQ